MVTITETIGDLSFTVSAETADEALCALRRVAGRVEPPPRRGDLNGVIKEIARLVSEIPEYFSACP